MGSRTRSKKQKRKGHGAGSVFKNRKIYLPKNNVREHLPINNANENVVNSNDVPLIDAVISV